MYKAINFNNRIQHFEALAPFVANCLDQAIHRNPEYRPYFMTYTFSKRLSFDVKRCAPFVFTESERLYHHIHSRTISNHARKPDRYPYSFEFFDVANTRERAYVNFRNPVSPHVHAVMLFHESAVPKLNELIAEKFESIRLHVRAQTPNRTFPSLTSIHAEPVVDLAELPKVVSYAAKLLEYDCAQKFMSQHECDLYVIRTPPRLPAAI